MFKENCAPLWLTDWFLLRAAEKSEQLIKHSRNPVVIAVCNSCAQRVCFVKDLETKALSAYLATTLRDFPEKKPEGTTTLNYRGKTAVKNIEGSIFFLKPNLVFVSCTSNYRKFEFQMRDRELRTTSKPLENKSAIIEIISRKFKKQRNRNTVRDFETILVTTILLESEI